MKRFSLILLLLWSITAAVAGPLGKYGPYDETTDSLNHTLWPGVRIGGDGSSSQSLKISDLFLEADSNFKGGCASKLSVLDTWLKEAIQLHNALIKAYSEYKTNRESLIIWVEFFGIRANRDMSIYEDDEPLWKTIGDHISRVSEFLAGAGLRNPVKPGEKPRIFCSEDAGEYAPWDQPIKDENGKEIPYAKDENTGEVTKYWTVGEVFVIQKNKYADAAAYWMRSYNGYAFVRGALCTKTENKMDYAKTSAIPPIPYTEGEELYFGKANRYILFCPLAFDAPSGKPHSLSSLADAASSANYPSGAGTPKLDGILPRSATLYHELYHLTDNGDTSDPYYMLDSLLRAAQARLVPSPSSETEKIAKNPETYAFAAMAAYMNQNPPEGHDRIIYIGGLPFKPEAIFKS
ncbi:hypothetical protein McanMca71_005424 [Microsporum canis]|uniref:Uncharacterized protein n=1 Tax=Arthroderma otae (strain ATCC MYA-4605 / CBS 113480) TaxID=554155 RepID=C5FQP1_ARTOC|nr:conserved hypothetical protein [Microsporum canis CBS 113480]EEQ32194.1 conserved hypothetical protein [Microsporum canis CBS 113480]